MTPCEKTQQVHRSDQLLLPRTNAKSFVGQSFARPLCPPASNDPWEQGLTHTHTHTHTLRAMEQADTIGVELSFELCANFGSSSGRRNFFCPPGNSVPLDFQLGDMELHCKLRGIGECKELLLNAGGVPSHSLKQV